MGEVAALANTDDFRVQVGSADGNDAPGVTVDDEVRLISVSLPVVVVGQATFVIAATTMFWFFQDVLAPRQSRTVAALLILIVLGCTGFDAWLFRGSMAGKRVTAIWKVADLALAFMFSTTTILLVWFALPNANFAQWVVATAFCVGYVPVQISAAPDNALTGKISLVIVVGGFFLFILLHDWRANLALLTLLALYGAALFFMSDMFRGVVKGMIVARRQAEQANAELAEAILAVAAERDAKTRFIAAVSHDLSQPLQAARLFAEQAKSATNPWERDEAIGQVQTTLKATQTMLGRLLYHMRLEADEVNPQWQSFRLDSRLRELARRYAEAAEEAGIRIRVRCPQIRLGSDPVLLDRAIGNLLSNAIEHSRATSISVAGRRLQDGAEILVLDNGVGIPGDEATTIFDDYVQGSQARSERRGGFGLGLASVARVAKLLGGAASLIHPRRRGAAFRVVLVDRSKPR